MPSSVNVPSSISSAIRSRAVSLSAACWRSMRSWPPLRRATARRSCSSSTSGRRIEHAAELGEMIFERGGDVQEAAVLLQQVVEVQSALLRELRRQHSENALAYDRSLDHRSGVDPDDGGTMDERVVEVGDRLGGGGSRASGRKDDCVPEARQVDALPRRTSRVGPDHDPEPAQPVVRAGAQRFEQAGHKLHLVV
jgi:hypothetical protein